MKEELLQKIQKLRDEVSYQYYEISVPMESPKILKKLDTIIRLTKKL